MREKATVFEKFDYRAPNKRKTPTNSIPKANPRKRLIKYEIDVVMGTCVKKQYSRSVKICTSVSINSI